MSEKSDMERSQDIASQELRPLVRKLVLNGETPVSPLIVADAFLLVGAALYYSAIVGQGRTEAQVKEHLLAMTSALFDDVAKAVAKTHD